MTFESLGIIGCGKVGHAFIIGLQKNGFFKLEQIHVSSLLKDDRDWAASIGCNVYENNIAVTKACKLILLLVRPEIIQLVLNEINPHLSSEHLIVSVAAGVKLSTIEKTLTNPTAVCRIMINLQIESNFGTTAFAPGTLCSKRDAAFINQFLSSFGYCISLPEENFDVFTALAGSGPAFIYGVIEALAEGATLNGLFRKDAIEIATSMVKGASSFAMEKISTHHPCQLREAVCTPGGSSIQGMRSLEDHSFRAAFISAIDAATKKNKEFSEKF